MSSIKPLEVLREGEAVGMEVTCSDPSKREWILVIPYRFEIGEFADIDYKTKPFKYAIHRFRLDRSVDFANCYVDKDEVETVEKVRRLTLESIGGNLLSWGFTLDDFVYPSQCDSPI